MSDKHNYDLYLNTEELCVIKAGEAVLIEENSFLSKMGFRYTKEYYENPHSFSLDPIQLPLL
jgi:hypothetical protein